MPVRPFFIDAKIEGRQTPLRGGPKRKDGDVTIDIYQRDDGEITKPFRIHQYTTQDKDEKTGEWVHHLNTSIYYFDELIKMHTTNY